MPIASTSRPRTFYFARHTNRPVINLLYMSIEGVSTSQKKGSGPVLQLEGISKWRRGRKRRQRVCTRSNEKFGATVKLIPIN